MDLDFGLGEMADTIRDTVRRFALDRIEPIAADERLISSQATRCSR